MVSWFGFGESYDLHQQDYLGSWNALLAKARKWRFNTIRLAGRFADVTDGKAASIVDFAKLESIIDLLHQKGYSCVLDLCHNYADHIGYYGTTDWINNWIEVAKRFKNDDRIVAYELFNEPFRNTWETTITSSSEFLKIFASTIDKIRATGDNHIIVYPPPGYFSGIVVQPEFRRAGSVITHHPWSYGIPSTDEAVEKLAEYRISQVLTYRTQDFDLWDGEMGQHDSKDGGGKTYEFEKKYVVKIINLSIANSMGFSWWLYSKNHWKEGSADDIIEASDYALSPKREKP